MANLCMGSAPIYQNALNHNPPLRRPQRLVCKSMTTTRSDDASINIQRRSGNYQPSPWDHRYLLSIENKYVNEKEMMTRDVLKKKMKKMLNDVETKSRLEQLELIDDLQRLGVSYYFELKISNILTNIHLKNEDNVWKCDMKNTLHATALEFLLLRQHGFDVSEDIFDVIINDIENDMFQGDDIRSIISLYEASYLSTESDTKLHKVIRPFVIQQLRNIVDSETYNIEAREEAIHALKMPYHWRMRRLATRWYIDMYEKKDDKNLILIEFAKIDFNIVQAIYQEELKYVTSWWKETGLGDHYHFVRDRTVECYFWNVGILYQPQFGYVRRIKTIVTVLITAIDDIYDVYGTLEELELFTAAVENWDVNRLDDLPEYMRLCFLLMYNETNGLGYHVLKSQNIDVIPFLKKSWADLCTAYLVEAKWYKSGYKPSLKEYIQNAWISISTPTMLLHLYCAYSDQISIQILESMSQHREPIVRCSGMVIRLANDLATSTNELARGDVLKSVQCYMHETGASEEQARVHMQQMISDTWNEMNYEAIKAHTSSFLPRKLVEAAMDLARTAQCIYQHGDGHGCPEKAKTVERVQYLLINPIPLY